MIYSSTRNKQVSVPSSTAIINGISEDGGLYVPTLLPRISTPLSDLIRMDYKELAFSIMKGFLTDFEPKELMSCINKAYDIKFDDSLIAPLVSYGDINLLELFHGPTLAFKDMALSILPHLLTSASRKQMHKNKIVILTATSGDTGKAALEGFADVDDIIIIVFYPKDGVSEIQRLQMVTQEGNNTYVAAIDGNFDDAQNGVKKIFNDSEFVKELEIKNFTLSSANSINIGRLIPQIVYYFYGYTRLINSNRIKPYEKVNFVVPTGNFGNILAGYYAKKMGLPINKLVCASNENNVLYDFINTGTYDKLRELILTSSPSMDILVSSNLERLLYEISNKDADMVKNLMNRLSSAGKYEITDEMKSNLSDFYANYSTEEECRESIRSMYNAYGYIMDTHTAVAHSVYKKYLDETRDFTPAIIVSTASPFKFGKSVAAAIGAHLKGDADEFEVNELLSEASGQKIPDAISSLKHKRIIHKKTCDKNEMKAAIKDILER